MNDMASVPYIRERNGRWYFTVRDANGKKHEYAGGKTEVDCFKAYIQYMNSKNVSGLYENTRRIGFDVFLNEWLNEEVRPNFSDNTYDQYERIVRIHLIPVFGTKRLGQLTARLFNTWLIKCRDKGYAYETVKLFYNVIRSSFRWCVKTQRYLTVDESPALGLKMPKYAMVPKDIQIFSPEEIYQIFEAFPPGHYLHLPCMLAYGTGMRIGEILALTWDRINMEKRYIEVRSTLYDKKGEFKLEPTPKNISSIRNIAFSQKVYDALAFAKEQRKPLHTDFVCLTRNGKPMTSNHIRYFNVWCKRHFGHGSFHIFRHTHATMLMDHNVELDYVTKRLGHSNTSVTTRNYIRITENRNKTVMKQLDAIL